MSLFMTFFVVVALQSSTLISSQLEAKIASFLIYPVSHLSTHHPSNFNHAKLTFNFNFNLGNQSQVNLNHGFNPCMRFASYLLFFLLSDWIMEFPSTQLSLLLCKIKIVKCFHFTIISDIYQSKTLRNMCVQPLENLAFL